MLAFLSARFRRWLLLVLVLPLVGRGLEGVGARVTSRQPRLGGALTSTGRTLRRGRRRQR